MSKTPTEYELFISYASADKDWVRTLAQELQRLQVSFFLDELQIEAGQNFVLRLSDALLGSRFLVLILSSRSVERPWVQQEWTSFMATHGPLGRILPVRVEEVEAPAILRATQAIDATHRDAARVAGMLAELGKRRVDSGDKVPVFRDLTFVLERQGKDVQLTDCLGRSRSVAAPWVQAEGFGAALLLYSKLVAQEAASDADRETLWRNGRTLGRVLFRWLFADAQCEAVLRSVLLPGRDRPVITIRSDDDLLQGLPWELLCDGESFLLMEGMIDLVRSTASAVSTDMLLKQPEGPLKIVVNVSAPLDQPALSYEGESYRITRALTGQCRLIPTELGTEEDLIGMLKRERPTAVLFSGHGTQGELVFEDEECLGRKVAVGRLIERMRKEVEGGPPSLVYLACCHGNDAPAPAEGQAGSGGVASELHRAGVAEVVGYFGPIVDELSTRAEAAFFGKVARGAACRQAVRQARIALERPLAEGSEQLRPELRQTGTSRAASEAPGTAHPFAWAQLVLYHRGPEYPLVAAEGGAGYGSDVQVLQRSFLPIGRRQFLEDGFIGRRRELGRLRQMKRKGQRVWVLQGLGGLGKSTLAGRLLRMLTPLENVCGLWCQETEGARDQGQALVDQLLEFCRSRFGAPWESVVSQVDRTAGDDAVARFKMYLEEMRKKITPLVLYLDNLESLLDCPRRDGWEAPPDPQAFASWRTRQLESLWELLCGQAEQSSGLWVVASCRYRNGSYGRWIEPVPPLPPDALFRLMGWFPALRELPVATRGYLVGRLEGHPRAVEFLNGLVQAEGDRRREWGEALPSDEGGWQKLVEGLLPEVQEKLWADLLLVQLWEKALGESQRRMLARMSLLRRPFNRSLIGVLGEPDQGQSEAEGTAQALMRTSLLEQVDLRTMEGDVRHFTVHPATRRYALECFAPEGEWLRNAHRRIGDNLAEEAKRSPDIVTNIEAGYHLFQAAEYDAAGELLGPASDWLQDHGRVREGLQVLEPFLIEAVRSRMRLEPMGRLLGTIGAAHYRLGEVRRAIEYNEQQLVIARDIGDRKGEANALGSLGLAYATLGEVRRAIKHYEQVLEIMREIGDRRGEGSTLGNLGYAYIALGEFQRAIEYCEKHLAIARETEDRQGEAYALGNIGMAYFKLVKVRTAIEYYQKALVVSREIGDRQGEGSTLGNLGGAYYSLGEVQRAIEYYEQHLAIAREIGDRRGEGAALYNMGNTYATLKELPRAIAMIAQAFAIFVAIEDPSAEKVRKRLEELRRG